MRMAMEKLELIGSSMIAKKEEGATYHVASISPYLTSEDIRMYAHLFVAAPELLEACKTALNMLDDIPEWVYDRLLHAILKADQGKHVPPQSSGGEAGNPSKEQE